MAADMPATDKHDRFTSDPELHERIQAGLKIGGEELHLRAQAIISDLQAVASKPDSVPRGMNATALLAWHLTDTAQRFAPSAERPTKCQSCGVSNPAYHPATASGGEVMLCNDSWHQPTAAEIRAKEAKDAAASSERVQFNAMAWGDRIRDEQLDELLARAEKSQTVLLRIDQFRDLVLQAKAPNSATSAQIPSNIVTLVQMIDKLEDEGNGWNPKDFPHRTNEAERKFRDLLVANWTAIRRIIQVARSDRGAA